MQVLFLEIIHRERAGDYASGTNHLPTNGYAKNYSGVNWIVLQKQ
jgi:histidinol dehydrogenase